MTTRYRLIDFVKVLTRWDRSQVPTFFWQLDSEQSCPWPHLILACWLQ